MSMSTTNLVARIENGRKRMIADKNAAVVSRKAAAKKDSARGVANAAAAKGANNLMKRAIGDAVAANKRDKKAIVTATRKAAAAMAKKAEAMVRKAERKAASDVRKKKMRLAAEGLPIFMKAAEKAGYAPGAGDYKEFANDLNNQGILMNTAWKRKMAAYAKKFVKEAEEAKNLENMLMMPASIRGSNNNNNNNTSSGSSGSNNSNKNNIR